MSQWDIVVAGAGHNSLLTAAYAARAGLKVLVLEAADRIGGDTTCAELTLPGFIHDPCATARPWPDRARFYRADADAYRELLNDWQGLAPLINDERKHPPQHPDEVM